MDLKQYILALGARRKAFFVALIATIVTAIAVALIVPKKYVATASLMMDARDEQTMSPGRLSPRERATFLQTQVDLLMNETDTRKRKRQLERVALRTAQIGRLVNQLLSQTLVSHRARSATACGRVVVRGLSQIT